MSLEPLLARGVKIPHPELVVVHSDVHPERIEPGAVLLPGTRLEGARTLIGGSARIGTEGPTRVKNCGVGREVALASGTFEDSVFLDGASYGPSGHARDGTLFEEGASAGHAVGCKQTLLLPYATLGSNINFCDALLAGGTSAHDHSEVGSGFIHFNFTPYGPRGDKATPSRFGDVPRGVWLRERRIFLGGAGGVVGPLVLGYGTVLAAGSVYRSDRGEDCLVYAEALPPVEKPFDPRLVRRARHRIGRNLEYLANLMALYVFYSDVRWRLAVNDAFQRSLLELGMQLIERSMKERVRQLERFSEGLADSASLLEASGGDASEVKAQRALGGLLAQARTGLSSPRDSTASGNMGTRSALLSSIPGGGGPFVSWVRRLGEDDAAAGRHYLQSVVQSYLSHPEGAGRLTGI